MKWKARSKEEDEERKSRAFVAEPIAKAHCSKTLKVVVVGWSGCCMLQAQRQRPWTEWCNSEKAVGGRVVR